MFIGHTSNHMAVEETNCLESINRPQLSGFPNMGGFHKWGFPPVIIHSRLGFSLKETIQLLGYPHDYSLTKPCPPSPGGWPTSSLFAAKSDEDALLPFLGVFERTAPSKKGSGLCIWAKYGHSPETKGCLIQFFVGGSPCLIHYITIKSLY